MTASVTKLQVPKIKVAQPAKRPNKSLSRQIIAASFVGAVAMSLTGLSLFHLEHGIEIVTGSCALEAWLMAIGIDLGFVALELSQLMASTDKLRTAITAYTKPAIIGTMIGSACMNAFAFTASTTGWMTAVAAVFGVSIPALIWVMTKVGTAMYIDYHSRS